jgi:hypothetical protein
MNRLLYALHKWISALAFVQLAIWTVSGFAFTWIAQESIQSKPVDGANRSELIEAPPAAMGRVIETASAVTGAIDRVELRGTPDGPFYVAHGANATARVDARTGQLAPVDRREAEAIAQRDQPGSPPARETTLVTAEPPIEYRDCEPYECALPAWRVALGDADRTVVYVDATTGDVTARRNDRWRLYDFFWSLHIMDYRRREGFNHALIRGAAVLAMATVASGMVLLAVRASRWVNRWVKRRRSVARPALADAVADPRA